MNWTSKVKAKLQELKSDDGYFVYDLNPDKADKNERYQFASSTQADIVNQTSLFLALREYHESRRLSPSWERFEYNFERCFPIAVGKSPHWGDEQNPWGRPFNDRPKFKVLYPQDEDSKKDENNRILWLIEFWPVRTVEEESHLLMGFLNDVILQAVSIMQNLRMIEDLDHVVGLPITEHLKIAPKVGLMLQIIFSNYRNPPFYKSVARPNYIEHQVSIPFVKRTALEYRNIRQVCGGSSGLNWGRERCTAYVALSTDQYPANKKGMPQIWCGGGTPAQAKQNCKQMLQLSDAIIIGLNNSGKDYREGTEAKRLQEEIPSQSYKVYPAKAWIENSRIVEAGLPQNATPARKILLGKLNKKTNRFRLDFENEPYGFSEAIEQLTRWDN